MPLLKLETNVTIPPEQQRALIQNLSKCLASTIGKPEKYVMVTTTQGSIIMSGKEGDAALVEVRSIGGLTVEVNRHLSKEICQILADSLRIHPERIYINFLDVQATHWGWDGSTFG